MTHIYIPILRWKRGERVACEHLSASGKQDVRPLFVLGTDQYVGREATRTRAAISPANVVANELDDVWGPGPFYIDAIAAPAQTPHPLVAIATAARRKGLRLIPATTLGAPTAYQSAVAAVVRADQRGVGLRVDLAQFSSAAHWATGWPYPPNETDLILDLQENVGTVHALGAGINNTFTTLHNGNLWRTVTICGTSMPENFVGYPAGQHLIPRHEVALWQRLSALSLPYRLDYGDYATVSVIPPPSGIRWGFPINVRYTLPQQFLICRGVNTTGPGAVDADVQLIGHATAIRGYAGRNPLGHCWGDQRVDQIAAGAEGPQGLEHWVRIGVNRHIEITRHHLP